MGIEHLVLFLVIAVAAGYALVFHAEGKQGEMDSSMARGFIQQSTYGDTINKLIGVGAYGTNRSP